jgi:hypothetical protein
VEFLVEVCDPSEAKQFGYAVNGIVVSDFYTEHFFDPIAATGVRYSFTGAISEPRQVLHGGYLSWHDPTSNHWWQETWFDGSAPKFRDIGPLDGSQGSLRAQIDRITGAESARAMRDSTNNEGRRGLLAAAIAPATASKAAAIRAKIDEILHHSTDPTNAPEQPSGVAARPSRRRVPRRRE